MRLNIAKASLHYHFPTKVKLGERRVERYQIGFLACLARIDETPTDAGAKLQAYVQIYADVLDNDRMCLCGMLAADYAALPETIKDRVRQFFEANEAWLTQLLQRGRIKKSLTFQGSPVENARYLVSSLEGAMLLARTYGDTARFRLTAARVLSDFGAGKPRTASKRVTGR